jgi:hypothetical protein
MSAKQPGALAPIPPKTVAALSEVSVRATAAFGQANTGDQNVLTALDVAESVDQLRHLLDTPEVMARIEALQDTSIGFRTDSDPKVWNKKKGAFNPRYEWPVVRDCALEAALRGLQWVGNQFNIITGRMYCTKEGFEYLIKRCKAVTEFRPVIQVPRIANGGAIVECSATWKMSGQPVTFASTIPVKMDEYSGADQIIGKATRKFLKRCYEQMSGISVPEAEAEEGAPRMEGAAEATSPRFLGTTKAAGRTTAPDDDQIPGAEVPPSTAKAPTPPPASSSASPQEQLAAVIVGAGYNFDQFLVWAKYDQFIPEKAELSGFDEVPVEVASRLLRSQRGVVSKLGMYVAKGGAV